MALSILKQVLQKAVMRLKTIDIQHSLFFKATLECEYCGDEQHTESRYGDSYFHKVILADIYCRECDNDVPVEDVPRKTTYLRSV